MSRATHRYATLTGLHWLSTGLAMPVQVLLLHGRGLSLAAIGGLYAAYAAMTGVLELPTGGLADVWGRRPVLATSAALALAGHLALALAADAAVLVAAVLVLAVARALSSGPLEAWFVDTARLDDPGVDLTLGLSRGTTAEGLALAAGALVGGFLPGLARGLPARGEAAVLSLSVPLLVASAVVAVELVTVLAVVRDAGLARTSRPRVTATLVDAVALAAGNRTVRRILLRFSLVGFGVMGLELVIPARLASLLADPEAASRVYAVLTTVAFAAAAAGAAAAPAVRRRAGSAARGAFLATLLAGGALVLTGVPALPVLVAGFVAAYVLVGPARPLLGDLLHAEVDAGRRATLLSAQSVAMMGGAVAGSVCLPALADAAGQGWALAGCGVAAALGALPLLGLTRGLRPDDAVNDGAGWRRQAARARRGGG